MPNTRTLNSYSGNMSPNTTSAPISTSVNTASMDMPEETIDGRNILQNSLMMNENINSTDSSTMKANEIPSYQFQYENQSQQFLTSHSVLSKPEVKHQNERSNLDDNPEDSKHHSHQDAGVQYFIYQPQQHQQQQYNSYLPLVTPPTAPQQHPLPPPSPTSDENGNKKSKRAGVPHIYHDYSAVPDSLGYVRKKTGGVTQPFPEKLMEMLSKETDCPSIVGWLPHGRAFIVRKPKAFTSEIMPKVILQMSTFIF
jgi:hypothetical protein